MNASTPGASRPALAILAFGLLFSAAAPAPARSGRAIFDLGGAAARRSDEAVLEKTSRLYWEGKSIVMIVTGETDAPGAAEPRNRRVEITWR